MSQIYIARAELIVVKEVADDQVESSQCRSWQADMGIADAQHGGLCGQFAERVKGGWSWRTMVQIDGAEIACAPKHRIGVAATFTVKDFIAKLHKAVHGRGYLVFRDHQIQ